MPGPSPALACSSSSTLVQSLKVDRSLASPCKRCRPGQPMLSCAMQSATHSHHASSACKAAAQHSSSRPSGHPCYQKLAAPPKIAVAALHPPGGPASCPRGRTPRCARCGHRAHSRQVRELARHLSGEKQAATLRAFRTCIAPNRKPTRCAAVWTGGQASRAHLRAATVISSAGSMARLPSG